ncbi:transcriptional regulator Myc-A-like [Dunckerocampus dactyliophorus]|uniref:transcriptional regulator Myc-A-like n=1 Tax=Dunckerocampus dactyliophorus TaxID=161453 RepID=UPI0024076022|nr:transcriptional regulator Myc-A-like [Dunckerocampus dactyliophorus]
MYITEEGMEEMPYVCSFFDEEFCQSLMKDLQSLPTPPQCLSMKVGLCGGGGKPLSKGDQLSYVSDILLEDQDTQLNWNCSFFHSDDAEKDRVSTEGPPSTLEESSEDGLWKCLAPDKSLEEKLVSSMLGSSPLLSDIDTSIFEGLAGSMLDCQNLMETQEPSEATSDYGTTDCELSNDSSSDSEEEIDVVTVGHCSSSPPAERWARQQKEDEKQRALQRHHLEIQQQHNYAAPRPASPSPSSFNKHSRGGDRLSRPSHSSCSYYSSPSTHYHNHHREKRSFRSSAETEDEEERRRTHNVMERQRRNELKNCFVRLRDNVPELLHYDKASKVVILKKARDCIYGLEDHAFRLQAKQDKLRAKQEELKTRLEQLRR